MRTIVESIKANSVNESTNVFNLDALAVKDLYDLIKNNKSGDFQDIIDDIADIIDMDNTTAREDDDIVKILELIRDHCFILGPEGGYDGNDMNFGEVADMYKFDVKGYDFNNEDDVYDFFDLGEGQVLPKEFIDALKKLSKMNIKYAAFFIVSGYDFPCFICFDVVNPLVKKFCNSIATM